MRDDKQTEAAFGFGADRQPLHLWGGGRGCSVMICSLIFLYKDSDLFDSAEGVDAHYVAQGHGAREVDAGVGVDNEFVLVAGTETASEPTAVEVGEGHVDGVTQQIRTVAW